MINVTVEENILSLASGYSTAMTTEASGGASIGSLWRRVLAFIVDGIMLGIVVSVVALPLFEPLSHLGPWGRLVGFCIALPYFAIMESTIGKGQTLGKRWMHLRVVGLDGQPISPRKSVIRYALFAVPYFLNGLPVPLTRTPWIISGLISIVVAVLGGSIFYLVCFNRRTRQGIHDLAVGSYVVDADCEGAVTAAPIWRTHWVILVSLLVALFAATGVLGNKLAKWGSFPQMLRDLRLVEQLQNVQRAGIQDMTQIGRDGAGPTKICIVDVFWTGKSSDQESFATSVARLIIQNDPTARDRDILRVAMIRGYDLGIAHAQVSRLFQHPPAEW